MAISQGGAQSASSTVGGSRWISRCIDPDFLSEGKRPCSQIQRRVLEITLLNTTRKRGRGVRKSVQHIWLQSVLMSVVHIAPTRRPKSARTTYHVRRYWEVSWRWSGSLSHHGSCCLVSGHLLKTLTPISPAWHNYLLAWIMLFHRIAVMLSKGHPLCNPI
jgi:hypothetical protein